MVPYVVGTVVAVTVMYVRECYGARVTAMLVWGPGEVVVSAYMGGTHSSGEVQEMNVVRGVGGVCDMCMCLARTVWEV